MNLKEGGGAITERRLRVNEMIRVKEVRLIDPEGKQLGIMSIEEARQVAEDYGLDLVEVAPDSRPPVCKIMDYGRWRYQQAKRSQEARRRQHIIQVKEVKLRPKTDEHDFQFKLRHIRRFLSSGNKAKVTVVFRGREMEHPERGEAILERVAQEVQDVGRIEQLPRFEGRGMSMVLAPNSQR
jgi:translation initiation factor IF-3